MTNTEAIALAKAALERAAMIPEPTPDDLARDPVKEWERLNLILRIGQDDTKRVIVLRNYEGSVEVCDKLLNEIRMYLDGKYDGHGWKYFNHIEILGECE